MDVANVRDSRNNAPALRVDDDYTAIAQVSDEEQVPLRIEGLIIESRRVAGQRDVGNALERRTCRKTWSDASGAEHCRS
jgi:hypothetical protein